MPNMSKQYQLILGTFIDNEFIWHDVDSYDTLEEAYKEFKKYVNAQLKYTDEELIKVWNSGRLDVELRRGNRLLNWVGIYAREVDKLAEEEEEEANKENPEKKEKKETKDSLDTYPVYKADLSINLPDIFGEETTATMSISFKDDGSISDPENYIFSQAAKQVERYFKRDEHPKIFGTFTCDGQEIDAGKYQAEKKWGKILWVPLDLIKDSFQFSKEQYESAKDELAEKIFADPEMLAKYVSAIEYYRDIDIPKPALTSKEEFKKYLEKYFDLWDIYNTLEFLDDEGREFLKTDVKDDGT